MTIIQNHCRNYLPHIVIRKSQFVTFRLYDSLPRDLVSFLKRETKSLSKLDLTSAELTASQRKMLKLVDSYEDSCYGQCFLKDERVADMMVETMKKHDGKMYRLYDWCVMPNHVHAMLKVNVDCSLSSIIHSWKSYSAHRGNAVLGRSGPFWMGEYYDRYIRSFEHGVKVSQYIVNNPVKAGFVVRPEEWRWSSAWKE